jgi:hypothetical protein
LAIRFADWLTPMIRHRLGQDQPWDDNRYAMSPDVFSLPADTPFMAASSCAARDFYHPEFRRLCDMLGQQIHLRRKLWEWIFITHHALASGVVRPGSRGLVFGVGREPLPAAFAMHGMRITATDAPEDIASAAGWSDGRQRSDHLSGLPNGRMDRTAFERAVEWRPADMTAIPADLTGYDLVWSSCALEHLGSLQAGLDFIVDSVERTLAPGGFAIHTTELNLTSNDATLDRGDTVLYRRRDFEALIAELRKRGHQVHDFVVAPDTYAMDTYVDTPPYRKPHLRARFFDYVTTSAGIVIRKAR